MGLKDDETINRGDRGAPGFSVRLAATAPSASASAGGAGLPALPALSGQGDGQLQLMLTGRVLAISGTSITIGGNGPSVTADRAKPYPRSGHGIAR
jgi:hypothetical protein